MTISAGTQVIIYTTDPASLDDLKDFCTKTRNILVSQSQNSDIITTIIQRKIVS